VRELVHTCQPRGSDEGLKAPTLVAHWRKPLPSERGEPADAGDLNPLEPSTAGSAALCATVLIAEESPARLAPRLDMLGVVYWSILAAFSRSDHQVSGMPRA
jgi:hypothetical protein